MVGTGSDLSRSNRLSLLMIQSRSLNDEETELIWRMIKAVLMDDMVHLVYDKMI